MTAVTPDTRHEWTTRLAQTLVQSGYETDANLKPLVNEAIATDQSLAYLLVSRKLALPSVVVGTLAQLSQLPAVDDCANVRTLSELDPPPTDPSKRAVIEEASSALARASADLDRAPRRRVLRRVLDQIDEHLLDERGVERDER